MFDSTRSVESPSTGSPVGATAVVADDGEELFVHRESEITTEETLDVLEPIQDKKPIEIEININIKISIKIQP